MDEPVTLEDVQAAENDVAEMRVFAAEAVLAAAQAQLHATHTRLAHGLQVLDAATRTVLADNPGDLTRWDEHLTTTLIAFASGELTDLEGLGEFAVSLAQSKENPE